MGKKNEIEGVGKTASPLPLKHQLMTIGTSSAGP